jgi:hypothetical protein
MGSEFLRILRTVFTRQLKGRTMKLYRLLRSSSSRSFFWDPSSHWKHQLAEESLCSPRLSGSVPCYSHHSVRSPTHHRPSAGCTSPAAGRVRGTQKGERSASISPSAAPSQTKQPHRALCFVRPKNPSPFSLSGAVGGAGRNRDERSASPPIPHPISASLTRNSVQDP